jgi:hypothetical protein
LSSSANPRRWETPCAPVGNSVQSPGWTSRFSTRAKSVPFMRSCGRPVTPDPTRHTERRAQLTSGITDTPPTSARFLGDALAPPTRPPADGDTTVLRCRRRGRLGPAAALGPGAAEGEVRRHAQAIAVVTAGSWKQRSGSWTAGRLLLAQGERQVYSPWALQFVAIRSSRSALRRESFHANAQATSWARDQRKHKRLDAPARGDEQIPRHARVQTAFLLPRAWALRRCYL